MSHNFTRKELYDLVWSEPMRDLAKRFEISDVGLAKACRNADIPVPPRGYWNRQKAGHRVVTATLPPRRPGHSDSVTIGRDRRWFYADRPELDEPDPEAPTFEEPIEAVRARVFKAIAQISIKTKLEILHPAIKALFDKDDVLREKQKTYACYKPQFDDPAERRRLRILNAVFLALGSQGYGGSVRGERAGEIHVQIGHSSIALALEPIQLRGKRGGEEPITGKQRLKFGLLDGHDRYQPKIGRVLAEDTPERPIERTIREIVIELIVLGEEEYRERQLSHHKWRLEDQARRRAEMQKQKEEAERKERERLAAEEKARVDRLLGDAAALHQADQIRTYVTAVYNRPQTSQDRPLTEAFARWRDCALQQADRIDPVKSGRFLQGVAGINAAGDTGSGSALPDRDLT